MPVDQLVFIMGQVQTACSGVWIDQSEHFHPWAAIFLADFLRGMMDPASFIKWFSTVNSDYLPMAECVVEYVKTH